MKGYRRIGIAVGALLVSLALPAAGSAAAPGSGQDACSEQDAFERGRSARAAREGCSEAGYREALRLGSELAALEGERDRLVAEKGGDAAARARQQRLLEVDIDAIRALLLTRGISVDAGPSPESGR